MSSQLFAPDTNYTPHEKLNFDALPLQDWPEQSQPGDQRLHLISNTPHTVQYRLGDPTLPIAFHRDHVLETFEDYQSVILSSATGSGKSSQLGLYLLEAGVPRVFVSSPRILAARALHERAQFSLGPDYSHLSGYLTGNAEDSDCGPDARLIYVTEQLLFKMVNRGDLQPEDVIINDEAHERTVGTIALLGLTKEVMQDEPTIKLLVSSATIDTGKFSRYLADPVTQELAPVLILPGRTHPIKKLTTDLSVAKAAREYMEKGKNVLAFQPGITRLQGTRDKMASRKSDQHVHMLYGDQSPTEQARSLNPEDGHHVVASRIGETSITPEGKDVVIDSGLSNIGLYEEGVRVLKTVWSSKATMEQRQGRVGRTKPGVYVLATPEDAPVPPPLKKRDDYDLPSMETSSVAPYIIELLATGRKLEDMDLLEDPTQENLRYDYRLLQRLGAIAVDGKDVVLTNIGKAMTDLPLDVSFARMLIEARTIDNYYDVDTTQVRLQVAAIAAMSQVNGILNGRKGSERKYLMSSRVADDNLSNEHSSDPLFSLDSFVHLIAKQQGFEEKEGDKATERFEYYLTNKKDILVNRYYKARKTFEELCRREDLDPTQLAKPSDVERKAIIGCQIAGTEELFVQHSKLVHHDIRGQSRRLGQKSTIDASSAELVAGSSFTMRGLSPQGPFEHRYISGGSKVDVDLVRMHAPDRVTEKRLGHIVKDGNFRERQFLYFDTDLHISEGLTTPAPTLESREFIIRAMMTGIAAQFVGNRVKPAPYESKTPNAVRAIKQWETAQDLEHRSRANLRTSDRYDKLIRKVVAESVKLVPLDVVDPRALDEVIPPVFLNSIVRPTRKNDIPDIVKRSPDAISIVVNEEDRMYIPVKYRNNVAYVTISRGFEYSIKLADIEDLLEHHPVKIQIGDKGQWLQSEAFFKYIEERQNAPKRVKRIQRREEAATSISTPETLAQATERVQQARKRPTKQKAADQPMAKVVAKKYSHRQRRPSNKAKELEAKARIANQL